MAREKSEPKISHSAGGIVLNDKNQVLVVNQNNNSWSLPKGHLDPGETARQAAEREIYEESGVNQLTFVSELGSYTRHKIGKNGKGDDPGKLKKISLFLFKTTQNELKPIDPMNPQARWVDPGDVSDLLTHPVDKLKFTEFWTTQVKPLII